MSDVQTERADLLTQDGHLSELTLNRLVAGEFSSEDESYLRAHIDECEACEGRLEAVEQFDARFSIAPPASVLSAAGGAPAGDKTGGDDSGDESSNGGPGEVHDLAAERASRGLSVSMVGLALAAAAAIFLAINLGNEPQSPEVVPDEIDDGIRLKGSGLSLAVYAKPESGPSRAVSTGDVVHPGERLGFQLTNREQGHVMILGIDDRGTVYPVYPQSSADAQLRAVFMEATPGGKDLEAAIRLDDAGSSERLVAARCPEQFTLRDLSAYARKGTEVVRAREEDRMRGCVYDEVTLSKQASR